jgi:hypothetical protein
MEIPQQETSKTKIKNLLGGFHSRLDIAKRGLVF